MSSLAIDPNAVRELIHGHWAMPGEIRVLLPDVDWDSYQNLVEAFEDGGIRLTYLEGTVEAMVAHFEHEGGSKLLSRAIEELLVSLRIRARSLRSTTFTSREAERGLEPDECYYLGNFERLRGQTKGDLNVIPPPDLVIEVEITSPLLDKLGIYARLGFPEVWRFDGETLTVLVLGGNGTYAPSQQSRAFPFLPLAEFRARLATYDPGNETEWFVAYRDWVRAVVAPLYQV